MFKTILAVLLAFGLSTATARAEDKYVKLVHADSGKVLDVEGDSRDEGGGIIQWDDKAEDHDNQRWSLSGEEKARRLMAKSSGLVLDVGDEGAIVQKKSDDAAKGQVWRVVAVEADAARYAKLVHA